MPIRIKQSEAQSRVVVICDVCAEEITDAKKGNYYWRLNEDGSLHSGVIYFNHKQCARRFEEERSEAVWFTQELECLPIYLERNLDLSREDAERKANLMGRL